MGNKTRNRARKAAAVEAEAERRRTKAAERRERQALRKQRAREAALGADEEALFAETMRQELGLRIKLIRGDGNCMFRALADQWEGAPDKHAEYRTRIVRYIEEHREEFEPFVEDDEGFDAYLARMGRVMEWGGQQELYAATCMLDCKVVVHQFQLPRFVFTPPTAAAQTRELHLSYHGEMHYNSVRMLEDPDVTGEPPMPITVDSEAKGASAGATSSTRKAAASEAKNALDNCADADLIRRSVPWASDAQIIWALNLCNSDSSDTIEMLIASEEIIDTLMASSTATSESAEDDAKGLGEGAEAGEGEGGGTGERQEERKRGRGGKGGGKGEGKVNTSDSTASAATAATSSAVAASKEAETEEPEEKQQDKQAEGNSNKPTNFAGRARRNEPCPCGSGKKYGKCCRKRDIRVARGGPEEIETKSNSTEPEPSGPAEIVV